MDSPARRRVCPRLVEKLLFDASSLILALKLKRLEILRGNHIQQLALRETLNGLWKEARLAGATSAEEATAITRLLVRIVEHTNILSPHGTEAEILKTALERGAIAYDASYIVLDKNNGPA